MKKIFSFLGASLSLFLTPLSTANAFEFSIIPRKMSEKFDSGNFNWSDLVAFGLHLIQLFITLAGALAVILLMVGGFKIIYGSISEEQDEGKNAIRNTLIGLAVIILAWFIVDLLIATVTDSGTN